MNGDELISWAECNTSGICSEISLPRVIRHCRRTGRHAKIMMLLNIIVIGRVCRRRLNHRPGRGAVRGPKTLKGIVSAIVIVPILVVTACVADAKVHLLADLPLDARDVDVEDKLVAEPVARAGHVGPLNLLRRGPVVQSVLGVDLFVEIEVNHTYHTLHCGQIAHVSTFQFDFLISEPVKKVCAATGLRK